MSESLVEQEKNFNILKNPAGDLMILIRARLDDSNHPKIIYNGGKHAVLYRNDGNVVVLDFIHPSVRADLERVLNLLVVEAHDGSIIREYMAEVKHMKEIPLPNGLQLN
ncbi:MAG: hypothetical protein IJV07_03055 [Alphaproteobacteria bacterium]|nr:hypothetical protein [Alphaproteobacteria bacterium]